MLASASRSGSLTALFVALAALIFLSSHDTAFATDFSSFDNAFSFSNTTPDTPYDYTSIFQVNGPGGLNAGDCGNQPGSQDTCDANFSSNTTFTPPNYYVHHGSDLPIGAVVGNLSSNPTTLSNGASHSDCDQGIVVTFNPLVNASIDPQDTIDPRAPGVSDRFNPLSIDVDPANGIPDGADRYPSFLLTAFDPDGPAGPAQPLIPRARYFGIVQVLSDQIPLQFLIFNPGQLQAAFTGANSPLGELGGAFGYGSVTVLSDPTAPLAPSSITDFCSPLTTTTNLFGITQNNSATGPCPPISGGDVCEAGFVRAKNPPAGKGIHGTDTHLYLTYATSQRDIDDDDHENALDTCPFDINDGNPRDNTQGVAGGDTDNDGIDDACDSTLTENTDGGLGTFDHDGDAYENRQDNCPQDFNFGQNAATDGGPSDALPPTITGVPGPADGGSAGSGIGDACQTAGDSDWDGDGTPNATDNCTWVANAGQADDGNGAEAGSGDGTGNVCDPAPDAGSASDVDGDTILNSTLADSCALRFNSGSDTDSDGIDNACDPNPGIAENSTGSAFDFDRDGFCNPDTGPDAVGPILCSGTDNCPITNNFDQLDSDGDGIGNSCDPSAGQAFRMGHYHTKLVVQAVCIGNPPVDADSDGWCDSAETAAGLATNSPGAVPENQYWDYPLPTNEDGADGPGGLLGATPMGTATNGVAGVCTDGVNNDGDGSTDTGDTECTDFITPSGQDTADRDSLNFASDNCDSDFNPDQTDTDGDGAGDACDLDDDDDGAPDTVEYFVGTDPLVACSHDVSALNAANQTSVLHKGWAPDTSGDNFVSAGDFGLILDSWQLTEGIHAGYIRRADLSGDNTVSAGDFGFILDDWQTPCTPVAP